MNTTYRRPPITAMAKTFLAAGGLALSLACFGLTPGAGIATADTGSYDKLLNLQLESCWHSGMASGCAHSRDTSSYPLAASYPAHPSYPAASSWPGGNAKP